MQTPYSAHSITIPYKTANTLQRAQHILKQLQIEHTSLQVALHARFSPGTLTKINRDVFVVLLLVTKALMFSLSSLESILSPSVKTTMAAYNEV